MTDQSDTAVLIQELTYSVSIIELGINKAHIAIGENIALNKQMHCSNTMIKRITETNEHNTDRLLITIGKLRHEMEEVKLRQGDESVAGSAVRTLHETVSTKDEEIKRSNQMNAYLIEEVNKLKTTVQYMETVNMELVGTIAILQNTIAGLNQTIQGGQPNEGRENPSDAANQLEIDFMLVKEEYDLLMENLHLEIMDLEHREGLFQEQRKAFKELSTRREKEIHAQELDLTQHIKTCENASKQIGESDMQAHLFEQAHELDRREIEMRKSREELRREHILLKQQRGELARQANWMKGIDERENNLNLREQEYEVRNGELERQRKNVDSILNACVELKKHQAEAEEQAKEAKVRQAEAEELLEEAKVRQVEAEELLEEAKVRQVEAEELVSKYKECKGKFEEQTRILLEREGNLRDREAEFDKINTDLAKQRKYVDEIVGASAELKKKQAEVECQAKGLAEARKMLLAYEQSNDERERRNKEAEAKNQKLQKDLEKRRKGFEESIKTKEAELAKRHEQLVQDREALIEQEQKIMPSIQMVQVIGNPTVLTQDSSVQTKEDDAELQIASQVLIMDLTLNDIVRALSAIKVAASVNNNHMQFFHNQMNERLHSSNRVIAELRQQNEKLNADLRKQNSPQYEKVISECHARLTHSDECIAMLNETVKENEEAIQDLQADVAEAEMRLNSKNIAMRTMEKDAREKAEEMLFLEKKLEEMKQNEVNLLAKNEVYKKDVDQCQFVIEAVKKEICRQHENMKVAQREAVTRIQENEILHAENAKQQDKINTLKSKLTIQEEMVQQLVFMHNIPMSSVVYSPTSPTSPMSEAEVEDPIPVLERLQLETDNLEFDIGNANSYMQVLEVRMQARIIKVEEAYDQLAEANKQNLRELREYLIDKQGKETDAYMKEYNSKLSKLSEQLAESEQNNMMLVREKLEIDMEKSDALNHVQRLEHELKEALASKGQQQGKKKKGTDQALELAEKDIQIKRLTEDLERAKKRLTTTDNATKLARVTEELAKGTGELEDAKKFVASLTYKYNRVILDNSELVTENTKLTEIIKKLKEAELQRTRVKTQVVRVQGVNSEGNQVPLSSELVDKELTLKQATKQFNSLFGGQTTDETARSLLAIATNSALSFTKMVEVEKISETIDRLNDNFQARELMNGEESDDDKPVLGRRRRMVLDIVPVPASSSCGKASITELSSDESDDDDFNPFTMGENGCIANTTPQ